MKCLSALSTLANSEAAVLEVLDQASSELGANQADLVVLFVSPHHVAEMEAIAKQARARQLGRHLIGCTAESIVAAGREVEASPAIGLWAISQPGIQMTPLRLSFENGQVSGLREQPGAVQVFLGDPFTFPIDDYLARMNRLTPAAKVVGGMASGGHVPNSNRLILDDDVFDDGAVVIQLDAGVSIHTIVSQGCRPIGRPYVITRAQENWILELGGRPALQVFQELYDTLPPEDQQKVRQGLHLGRVINEYQDSFHRGDFLVRNVMGTNEAGAIAVTDRIRAGQTVQFQVRDGQTASEDLRTLLQAEKERWEGNGPGGALLFTCNGRGSRLFKTPDHDVTLIKEWFDVPVAGFFAMGELGPVGGQNFVHGFTASVVLFSDQPSVPTVGQVEASS